MGGISPAVGAGHCLQLPSQKHPSIQPQFSVPGLDETLLSAPDLLAQSFSADSGELVNVQSAVSLIELATIGCLDLDPFTHCHGGPIDERGTPKGRDCCVTEAPG